MPMAEIELKFLVPAASHAAVVAELGKGQAAERTTLAAIYLDTADRRLARGGLSWRLRREGRRWIQTLKAAAGGLLEREEHEVIRPGATPDAALHAGTPAGDRLLALLKRALEAGEPVDVRYRSDIHRIGRRVRTQGAAVEIAYDEGRLVAPGASLRVREIEFELASGDVAAMLALAERWRRRHGLVLDPRRKSDRGDRLADGLRFPPVRKAARPVYAERAGALEAFCAVLDECLAQILHNVIGLVDGDAAQRVEHVHQLRVGIRRLRSALRCFDGWAPMPPDALVDGLRRLFAELGQARDADVLDSGVAAALAGAGAPPLRFEAPADGVEPAVTLRGDATQRLLLQWLAWRATLADAAAVADADAAPAEPTEAAPEAAPDSAAPPPAASPDAVQPLARRAARRIARWHRRLADDARRFEALDEPAIHDLRKRAKRQRYAVEFFAPLLRRKAVQRYLDALAEVQDRMGELNDLFVARDRYLQALDAQPQAWFALGWLAARIAQARDSTAPALLRLAKGEPPGR